MSTTLTQVTLRRGGIDDLALVEPIMQAAFDPRYGEAWTRSQCAGVMAMPGVALTIADLDDRVAGVAITRTLHEEAEQQLDWVQPVTPPGGKRPAASSAVVGKEKA